MLQRDHGQRVQNIIISLWWSIAAYLMPPYRYQPTYTLQCPCIHASTKKLSALQAATRCHETNTDHSKGTCSCKMRGHGRKFSWSWHRKHSSTMRLAYHHVKGQVHIRIMGIRTTCVGQPRHVVSSTTSCSNTVMAVCKQCLVEAHTDTPQLPTRR